MVKLNFKKCMTLGVTACLMLGTMAVSGCGKKKLAAGNPNKDIESVIANLKTKMEDRKYSVQGDMQIYDGKTKKFTSFHEEMRSLVTDLSKAKFEFVDDWDPTKVTFPVYNFQLVVFDISKIGVESKEEQEASHTKWDAFWSNGYLITDSGDAWKCNFDFEKASKELGDFFDIKNIPEGAYSRMTALWNDKWYKENMMTLDEYLADTFEAHQKISKADGWNAKYKSRDNNGITVTITNESYKGEGDAQFCYGEYFGPIFVKIDGTWYRVPWDVSLGNIMYHDVGYMLYEGDSTEITNPFGYLPKGEYAAYVDISKDTGVFEYDLAEFTV